MAREKVTVLQVALHGRTKLKRECGTGIGCPFVVVIALFIRNPKELQMWCARGFNSSKHQTPNKKVLSWVEFERVQSKSRTFVNVTDTTAVEMWVRSRRDCGHVMSK